MHTLDSSGITNCPFIFSGWQFLVFRKHLDDSFSTIPKNWVVAINGAFFLNGAELSMNSVILVNSSSLRNHWSMNWIQFKGSLCYRCLPDAVVACWFLTQEIEGSNILFFFKHKYSTKSVDSKKSLKHSFRKSTNE